MKSTVFFLFFSAVLITVLISPVHSNSSYASGLVGPSSVQQFSSPEQTWALYKDALVKGNYELARKCCCEGKTKQVSVFERMQESKRQQILQNIKNLKKVYLNENKAKYQMAREVNGVEITSYVYFSRIDNEWKIEHH